MLSWIKRLVRHDPGSAVGPYQHERLGTLGYHDEGWWSGTQSTNHGDIEIIIVGSATGPNGTEAAALVERIAGYDALRSEALAFLAGARPSRGIDASMYRVTSIAYLWPHGGGHCFVNVKHPDTPDAIWRVEYVQGRPRHVSCDR